MSASFWPDHFEEKKKTHSHIKGQAAQVRLVWLSVAGGGEGLSTELISNCNCLNCGGDEISII